jgi:alkanesulfonate monooxygenase
MKILWIIPTGGDSRYLAAPPQYHREATFTYNRQLAQAIDELGYYGALLPTGKFCEDAWVMGGALLPFTKQMKFLIAVRPGVTSPTVAARMSSTFDRLSDGRLLINVVTGLGSTADLVAEGLHPDHDTRYEVTDEFLSVWRALSRGDKVDFAGKHLNVQGAELLFPPVQQPHPPLFFGGSSPIAHQVAAKHADVYVTWGEPLEQVAEQIATVKRIALDQYGRTPRFALRIQVVVRETESEAWDAANEIIRFVDEKAVAAARERYAQSASVGQARMAALHNGSRDSLIIGPNLWAGYGLVRGGSGTALVGDPQQIAARLQEYAEVGVEAFILSNNPNLEEAYRTAELLFPRLPLTHQEPISALEALEV